MIRVLLTGLLILHLGPGIAFVLFAFGCGSVNPALGPVCAGNALMNFVWITLVAWLLLGAGAALLFARARRRGGEADAPPLL